MRCCAHLFDKEKATLHDPHSQGSHGKTPKDANGVESMRPRSVRTEKDEPNRLVAKRDGAGRGITAPFDLMHCKEPGRARGADMGAHVVCTGKRLLRRVVSAKERRGCKDGTR